MNAQKADVLEAAVGRSLARVTMLLGREATFYYKGRRFRFTVEERAPARLVYSHVECANGKPEKLDLELLEITDTGEAVYRVRSSA